MTKADNITVAILGGSQKTGNLGVSALGTSCVDWLRISIPGAQPILEGSMRSTTALQLPDGKLDVPTVLMHPSTKLRARQGSRHLRALYRLARNSPSFIANRLRASNPSLDVLMSVDAVLDVSGGDSFAEIYGESQFGMQCELKELVLSLGIPLVLLPQTFGPFETEGGRARARRIIEQSALVITREAAGLQELEKFMGRPLDERFTNCPDMAFGLRPVPVSLEAEPFFKTVGDGEQIIGLNVSELLYYVENGRNFSIDEPYIDLMDRIVHWALSKPNTKLLLVPHVVGYEKKSGPDAGSWARSDREACEDLARRFSDEYAGRIGVLEGKYEPGEVKYAIGQCDFFIGARMHACIASLSQAIPTAVLAYSKKAAGVMGEVGVSKYVVEMRGTKHDDTMQSIESLYQATDEERLLLKRAVEQARDRIKTHFETKIAQALSMNRV